MPGSKCNTSFIIVLVSLFSIQAFSQQVNYGDSLAEFNSQKVILKPRLHLSVGSSFMIVPHAGNVTAFTLSPSISVPLSPKLSVDGGILARRFYSSLSDFNPEGEINGAFSEISVYGSASYHFNPQLTLYGSAIRQIAGTSPFYSIPKSSYSIGSTYNFGNFSIGVNLQMSRWNDNLSPFPFNGTQGLYSPYDQRPGTSTPFGR
jgi:hypothetical protein